MHVVQALILGCDLTPDGMALGPQSIARLEQGSSFATEHDCQLVVAAGYSPRHPYQPKTMAQMMSEWLVQNGGYEPMVLEATRFNTRGELQACEKAGFKPGVIISDPLHLTRTKILVRRMWGDTVAESMRYEATKAAAMTSRGQRLEPLKRGFLHLPFWMQDGVIFMLHKTPLRRINLSY